jgi:hypothetical protein
MFSSDFVQELQNFLSTQRIFVKVKILEIFVRLGEYPSVDRSLVLNFWREPQDFLSIQRFLVNLKYLSLCQVFA